MQLTRSLLQLLLLAILTASTGPTFGQTTVTFPDPNLEAAVRSQLNQPTGDLTSADLEKLTYLYAYGQSITNLSGLEWATNLATLSLGQNQVTNVSPLAGLTSLTYLGLYGNQVANPEALAPLTNLATLDLSYNPLGNCTTLSGLTNLQTLYLGGSSLTNIQGLAGLDRLAYISLDYNDTSDVTALAGLTNLQTVSLNGSPLATCAALSSLTNIAQLYLGYTSLNNLSCLAALPRLTLLSLDANSITNLAPLQALPSLTTLSLNYNPALDRSTLARLTNLTGLFLEGTALDTLEFARGLTRLTYLDVGQNQLTALNQLSGLANLNTLFVNDNLLTNLASLPPLQPPGYLNLCRNLIVFSSGSADTLIIQNLQNRGISVDYLPQSVNQPPTISAPTNWFVAANVSSSLAFSVSDDLTPADQLLLTARSSNTGLVANASLLITGSNTNRTLSLTPTPGQTGKTTITLTASDLPGLSNYAAIQLTVLIPIDIAFPDPNLDVAVRNALSRPTGPLTTLDLLALTRLDAYSSQITTLSGLEYAQNLTELNLYNNWISDLAPLAGLTQLTSLTLAYNHISDLAPLGGLTSLHSLDLSSNPLTSCAPLAALTNLGTLRLDFIFTGITNVDCLAGLSRLAWLSLQYGGLTDPTPLAALTGLQNLDLSGNSLASCTALAGLTNLLTLQLNYCSLTNAGCLAGLRSLNSLYLTHNSLADSTPLTTLTNLNSLDLSYNPVTNWIGVASLSNLTGLVLQGNALTNLSFLQGLTHLQQLFVAHNRLTDLNSATGLTNLSSLYAEYNRLTDITGLLSLPKLSWASVVGNALDLSSGSSASNVIQTLASRGVYVSSLPQNQPPTLWLPADWVIPANAVSTWAFYPSDDGTPSDQLLFSAQAADPALLPSVAIQPTSGNYAWNLVVTPATDQTGTTTVTVSATDEAGLSTNVTLQVSVRWATNVFFPDPNLEAAVRRQLGKYTGTLTSLDLESLISLYVYNYTPVKNLSGLEWASNLTMLFLKQNSIHDLTPLSRLTKLNYLDLSGNPITDVTPLHGLTSLHSLILSGTPINSCAGLCGLPPLDQLDLSNASLTNVDFLACLTNVLTLGLANNYISDPRPLLVLTNLQGLDLSANPLTDSARLAGFTNLTFLGLNYVSLSSLDGLAGLHRLLDLALQGTSLTTLTPLAGLTNLYMLDVSYNPLTNYSTLTGFTSLAILIIRGNEIADLGFVEGHTSLSILDLGYNRLADLHSIAGLYNLTWLDASFNLLTNIAALQGLGSLNSANLYGNLLDLNPGSAAMNVIACLQNRNVYVAYLPQNQPPEIAARTTWIIPAGQPASLPLSIRDDSTRIDQLLCSAHSSNTALVPDSNLQLAFHPPNAWPYLDSAWTLNLIPTLTQTGFTTITLTATDRAGFSTNAYIFVQVVSPQTLDGQFLNCTNLLWSTLGDPPWFGQTNLSHDHLSAARSGGLNSALSTTVTGPGTLTFWWRATSSGGYYAGGTFTATCAGSSLTGGGHLQVANTWRQQLVGLPAGTWTLRWDSYPEYGGSNTLWLDDVSFEPGPPDASLEILDFGMPNQFSLALHGELGAAYDLEASTDLSHWSALGTATLGNLDYDYYDDRDFPMPARFYRLHKLIPTTTPHWLEIHPSTAGSLELTLHSSPGLRFDLQTSTDLLNWTLLTTVTNALGAASWTDSSPARPPLRFYRARLLP